MAAEYLDQRFHAMLQRIADVYDGLGHSSGRPYLYFVYPLDKEQYVRRLADDNMTDSNDLTFLHVDLLPLTIESLDGQEEKRRALLNDGVKGHGAGGSIVRLWARRLQRAIDEGIAALTLQGRPVIVLRGLGALYPLGNPTTLMEAVAEREPRDPRTGKVLPIVLLVPGTHPPQSSRTYDFMGRVDQRLSFYRGEEL